MKHQLLLLLSAAFLSSGLFAQHNHRHDEMSCSHVKAKFYEEYYKSVEDVVQTPLLFDYDVKHYFLDIEVDDNSSEVSGSVTYLAESVVANLDTFAFEFLEVNTVIEVLVNGVEHDFIHESDEGFVPLETPVLEKELFEVKITYEAAPPSGGFFSGISTAYDSWGKWVTWTLSEPFSAREWWPTKQVLEDKADSVWVFLTTAESNMAGSNGLLTDVVTLPDSKLRYEWKSNYPIAGYLISFAVSQYQEYNIYAHPEEMMGDSVLIQNFIYDAAGCLENYKDGIDETPGMVELFSDLYYLYPFHEEKYGHCLTDLGGGMEHQTMSTMGGFGFWLVAHELGHMWFGDNVTCATWSDIWVNEGFASYSEYLALQYLDSQAAANSMMNGVQSYVMSDPGGSVYVPEDEVSYDNVWRIFNGRLSYDKGAAIIHMIRYFVNDDEVFFETLHNYQEIFKDSTATGLDFMGVLNETSGMDFTDFFDQWYFGEGYPTIDVTYSQDGVNLYLEISQTASKPSVTPLFTMPVDFKFFYNAGGDTTLRLELTDEVTTYMLPISEEIGLIKVDLDNWLLVKEGSITTNVSENDNPASFSFGPNPVKETMNVYLEQFNGQKYDVQVFDMAGSLVLEEKAGTQSHSFSTADLKPGNYLMKINCKENSFTRKFVKID